MHKLLPKAIFLNWLSIFELTELFRNEFRSPTVKVLRSGFCVSFVIVNDITCIPYTALGVSGFIHCSRGIPETWTQGLAGRKPFLEKYVSFDEAKTHIEYYILSQLALYADSLRHKNILNQNIPNELLYRFRRLSDKGWNKLHQERKRKDSDNVTLEEYSELCNMYLGINESEDCIATRE